MFLKVREADGQDGQWFSHTLQHLLDERFEFERRALACRADGHDGLLSPVRRAVLRKVHGLIAAEASERLVDAVEIHAYDIRLAHGLEDERRRYHIDGAHGDAERLRDLRAEAHERSHIGEDQHARAAVHAAQHRDDLLSELLRVLLERHVDGDEIRILCVEELLRDLDHRACR